MTGNLNHGQLPDPICNLSFRAKQADAFSAFPLLRKVGLRREKSLFASFSSFAGLRRLRLNLLFRSALLVLTFSLNAQAPTAVPIPKEPHHHLVFENEYVRVFRVSVAAHEATLLHQHDVPYLYVALGPADVINAVQGKPEVHLVMADGQLGYSRGGFAHIARNESDAPFNNVTIELLKPQGEPRNTCAEIVPGASELHCESPAAHKGRLLDIVPQFGTGETWVDLTRVSPEAHNTITITPSLGTLLVILSGSGIQTEVKGEPEETLHVGDVMWLLAGSHTTFSNSSQEEWSYLSVGFKGSEALHKY